MLKDRLRAAGAPAGLLLAALLAFGITLRVGFLWDDHRMIEQNPRLELSAGNLAAAFKGDPFAQGLNYYRPLQTVSNMADFSAWGLRPFGYHLTNLFFHAAAAVLFFYLALALGLARPAAFWAAALLAAHPAAVEQLLVIAGRAELASSACVAASLLLFLKRRPLASFVFFAAACGFKENGVVTPALAALCLWYLKREKKDYQALVPFFAFIPFYLAARHLALGMGTLSHGLAPVLSGLLLKVPASVLAYLKEAAFPFDMHSHRLQPDLELLRWAAPAALGAAGFYLYRKGSRLALFCAGWYLLNLAPKLPLLAANDLMLDHWVYLANAGLFLLAADKLAADKEHKPLLALAAAVLILASVINIGKRDTDLGLYEHAAQKSTSKPLLYNLAREYYLGGRYQKSRLLLERVSADAPDNPLYLDGLALARSKDGDLTGALAASDRALALKPGDPELLFNRYGVWMDAGKKKEGAETLAALLRAHPAFPPALLAEARALLAAGREREAEAAYRRALAAGPANLETLNDLGVLLAKRGDYAGAEELFRRALRLAPGGSAARNLLHLEAVKAEGRPR
ncbi:MAG: tetratricopeptide repeat protein [Elusimicrobiales bacterium]|nr:tetratricopeptide repeat protein [Elusimicrobiales bacterium]